MIKESLNLTALEAHLGWTNQNVVVSHVTFPWWISSYKNLRYQELIPPSVIVDQRILQSDWTRHIPGHTQRKVVVLHSTLAGWLSLNKKNKEIKRGFFSDWKRGSPGHTQPKTLVILLSHATTFKQKKIKRYGLVLSSDVVDQRILQSDGMRDRPGNIQPKVVVSDATLHWWLTPCIKNQDINWLFPRYC